MYTKNGNPIKGCRSINTHIFLMNFQTHCRSHRPDANNDAKVQTYPKSKKRPHIFQYDVVLT